MDDVAESAPVEVESGDSIWETNLLELPKQIDGPEVEVIGEMSPTEGTVNDQITGSVNNVVNSMSLGVDTDAQSLMDDVNENIRQEKKEELAATADDELKPITEFNTFEEYSEYLAKQIATGAYDWEETNKMFQQQQKEYGQIKGGGIVKFEDIPTEEEWGKIQETKKALFNLQRGLPIGSTDLNNLTDNGYTFYQPASEEERKEILEYLQNDASLPEINVDKTWRIELEPGYYDENFEGRGITKETYNKSGFKVEERLYDVGDKVQPEMKNIFSFDPNKLNGWSNYTSDDFFNRPAPIIFAPGPTGSSNPNDGGILMSDEMDMSMNKYMVISQIFTQNSDPRVKRKTVTFKPYAPNAKYQKQFEEQQGWIEQEVYFNSKGELVDKKDPDGYTYPFWTDTYTRNSSKPFSQEELLKYFNKNFSYGVEGVAGFSVKDNRGLGILSGMQPIEAFSTTFVQTRDFIPEEEKQGFQVEDLTVQDIVRHPLVQKIIERYQ